MKMKIRMFMLSLLTVMFLGACGNAQKSESNSDSQVAEIDEAEVNEYAVYDEYLLDNCYTNDGLMNIYFDVPDANGEGAGVLRGYKTYNIFTYKIKENGTFAIDYGKKAYRFYTSEDCYENYCKDYNKDTYNDLYKPILNDAYRVQVKHAHEPYYKPYDENSKAEVTFYERLAEYYNRQTGNIINLKKTYDEEEYAKAMKLLKDCKQIALEMRNAE